MAAPNTDFDLGTAVPVTSASAAPADTGFDMSTATPVDDADRPPETAGRVAGLAGRALAGGAANLVSLPFQAARGMDYVGRAIADPIRHMIGLRDSTPAGDPTSITDLVTGGAPQPYKPQLSDFVHPDRWQKAAEYFAEKAGAPAPAAPAERIGSAAVSALPSAVLAPEAPIAGALWSAAGGAASQATAEAGGGPVAQTLAGLAAGGAPVIGAGVAGATRALTRGAGADTAAAMRSRIANAADAGVNITAGQATGSRALQQLEGASSKFWGGGPIKATAEQQAEGLSSHVDRIVDNLSQGTTPSLTTAGAAINTGVAAAKQSMRQAEKAAYDKVDVLVPANSQVDVSGTLGKLDALATPTAGAESTTGALLSPTISDLRTNLASDAAKTGGTLPYSSVRAVRSAIGNKIDWGFSPGDPVTNGQLKQIYGALGDDLDAHASAISPEAHSAVSAAGALYKANQAKRDLLNGIVDKAGGPEAVYQAATNGTKLGATKIGGVMGVLGPDQQNLVRATVLDRLGRSISSQQNAAGTAFNPDTFLTNWAKMAPEAKDAIFGANGSANMLRRSLDSLEDTASTIRNSTVYRNPSGTAEAAGHAWGLWALLGGGEAAAMFGHPHLLAGAVGGIAGNAILSRALTNPATARWLAQTTKLPRSALPNAVNQLSQMAQRTNDPDARDLAAYVQAQQ